MKQTFRCHASDGSTTPAIAVESSGSFRKFFTCTATTVASGGQSDAQYGQISPFQNITDPRELLFINGAQFFRRESGSSMSIAFQHHFLRRQLFIQRRSITKMRQWRPGTKSGKNWAKSLRARPLTWGSHEAKGRSFWRGQSQKNRADYPHRPENVRRATVECHPRRAFASQERPFYLYKFLEGRFSFPCEQ